MTRYKCTAIINNTQCIFKRYGDSADVVKNELTDFINTAYATTCQIIDVQPDKTHTVSAEEQIARQTTDTSATNDATT